MARYPKGSKGNTGKVVSASPSPTISKKKGEGVMTTAFSSLNGIPNIPMELPPQFFTNANKWKPFGNDNLFPQAIARLTRRSPSHRGILNWKTIYCVGKGFTSLDEKDNELIDFINSCNADDESLKDIVFKGMFDKFSGGNAYIELVKDHKLGVLNIYHHDHTTCRLSKNADTILIHGNWPFVTASMDLIKEIPLYPVFQDTEADGKLRSIYHLKSYEPEFKFYGIPDWVAAMDSAAIAYKTNKWNVSRLDNSFQSSGTLVVEGNISPKEAKEMKRDFKREFTGETKQGKIMFIVKALGGGNTSFTPISQPSEGDWLQLHSQSTDDLIMAHSWFAALTGKTGAKGKMGDVQEIRNSYQIASNTVIANEQEAWLKLLKKLITTNSDIDATNLAFLNKPPLDMYDIDINSVMKVGEGRSHLGLPVDPNDKDMDIFISMNGPKRTATTGIIPGSNE